MPGALDSVAEIYDQNQSILDQIGAIAGQNQTTARELGVDSMRLGDLWFDRNDLARRRRPINNRCRSTSSLFITIRRIRTGSATLSILP